MNDYIPHHINNAYGLDQLALGVKNWCAYRSMLARQTSALCAGVTSWPKPSAGPFLFEIETTPPCPSGLIELAADAIVFMV
ncbi:hypothetical protein [Bradyrhizobium sp. STM 3566]|uniref:hypothetical protein n=1 Tax=Bradyrhizobium sp. STM 3566 TaxID=578928 RepID=UPI0038904CAA